MGGFPIQGYSSIYDPGQISSVGGSPCISGPEQFSSDGEIIFRTMNEPYTKIYFCRLRLDYVIYMAIMPFKISLI